MTEAQKRKFLEATSRGWSVARSARAAGVTYQDPYEARKVDTHFAGAWRTAYEAGTDRFEDAVTERALNGTSKGVWYKGQLVGHETEFSDTLLAKALAARRPSKWYRPDLVKGGENEAPAVRGEDVLSLLEQKLAGLEARGVAGLIESGDAPEPEPGST